MGRLGECSGLVVGGEGSFWVEEGRMGVELAWEGQDWWSRPSLYDILPTTLNTCFDLHQLNSW